jgi:hypothetical protein
MEKLSTLILAGFFAIFAMTLFADSVQQQEVISWAHQYSYDDGFQIHQFIPFAAFATSDGGFLISDGGLLKLNALGEAEWQKSYDCRCSIEKIVETSDGYLAAAIVDFLDETYFTVLRIDSNGNLIWSKRYRRNRFDAIHSLIRTQDSGYLLGASSASLRSRKDAKAWLVKISGSGNIQWQKTYNVARPNSLHQFNNGDFLVGTEQFSVLRLTRSGSVRWQKKFSGAGCCSAGIMQVDGENGFVMAGNQSTNSIYSVLLLKVDSFGSIVFSKTYAKQQLEDFQQTSAGGYILLSTRLGYPLPQRMSISKIDSNGNVTWRRISKTNFLRPKSILEASDGGYLATAADNFIFKFDSFGNIPNVCKNMFASAASIVENFTIKVEAHFPKVEHSQAVPVPEDAHDVDLTSIVESICP